MDKKEKDKFYEQFLKDTLNGMDISYNELTKTLHTIFHNKTKFVNGYTMKKCFRHIKDIIGAHQLLRREYDKQNKIK